RASTASAAPGPWRTPATRAPSRPRPTTAAPSGVRSSAARARRWPSAAPSILPPSAAPAATVAETRPASGAPARAPDTTTGTPGASRMGVPCASRSARRTTTWVGAGGGERLPRGTPPAPQARPATRTAAKTLCQLGRDIGDADDRRGLRIEEVVHGVRRLPVGLAVLLVGEALEVAIRRPGEQAEVEVGDVVLDQEL